MKKTLTLFFLFLTFISCFLSTTPSYSEEKTFHKSLESAAKLFKKTPAREELTDIFDIAKATGNKFDDLAGFVSGKLTRYGPINHGPLHEIAEGTGKVADTFRSSSYFENIIEEPVKLYRAYSSDGRMLSKYWSRTKPEGPMQAMLDSGLDPAWGNQATKWVEITVPKMKKFMKELLVRLAYSDVNHLWKLGNY